MPEFVQLIGPPACGKSTFFENLKKQFPEKNYQLVSTDKIIDDFALENGLTYFQAIMTIKELTTNNKLINDLKKHLEGNHNIIVDRTNMSFAARGFTMKYVPEHYTRTGIVFNVSLDNLRFRLKRRERLIDKYIPDSVIVAMNKSFQFPYGREFHNIQMIYS